MKISITWLALSGLVLSRAFHAKRDSECSPVHILFARGSLEDPGYGAQGGLLPYIERVVQGITAEAVVYPATMADYPFSQNAGIEAAKRQLSKYVKSCPKSKIVLMGYSQVRILSVRCYY
jgi:acetylxylan esterase